jgi:phytoene dehydrogenase-like protein
VFVDGFMGARGASDVLVPTCSLGELYDVRAAQKLRSAGVEIRHGAAVDEVVLNDGKVVGIKLAGGEPVEADFVMLAVAWRRVAELLPDGLRKRLPAAERAAAIKPSPITGVHLWFDRPILSLPHAVLVGRLSQWVFTRTQLAAEGPGDAEAGRASRMQSEHYYQIVISGSHDLAGRDRAEVIAEVVADLAAVLPAVRNATLLRSRMITEPESVFSMEPGIEDLRPSQRTGTPGLVLAGDWTKTGWPATMEGAVRSGYLAAETILADVGRPERIVVPDLPRGWLARAVLR